MRRALLITGLCLALGGCFNRGELLTGSTGRENNIATSEQGWRDIAARWRGVYEKDPTNATAALNYGRALRMMGMRAQALAVLETGAIKNTNNMPLLGEFARALADNGQFAQALDVVSRAHTPDRPDWRLLNVQGAVLDQLGRNGEAQEAYATALRLAPGEPSVLSNLGLSYALSNQLPKAEQVLRQAYAHPRADMRVRQNLSLVIALQGRFDEADQLARRDLDPEAAAQNTATLRAMLSQANNWQKLKQLDGKKTAG